LRFVFLYFLLFARLLVVKLEDEEGRKGNVVVGILMEGIG
jgi:hypothetical protein